MPHPLDSFFRPQSLAFIGATERSIWTRAARVNVKALGYPGKLFYVNRRGGEVLGKPAAVSAAAIGEPVDLALLMVPSEALIDSFPDLQAAGIRNAVVLSSGFAEAGEGGRDAQARLLTAARTANIRLLGPNCLGFVNFADRTPVWTVPVRGPVLPGRFAIVSQSGALAGQMSYFVQAQGYGLTYMVSTGNEADIDVAQVIDYLVDDEATKSIALFIETVRDTAAFGCAAQRALAACKPIVVLKIGSSAVTAKAAQAHTGSLVGDDRVFDAACRRYGMVRVTSLEDLIVTAELMARLGPLGAGGLGVLSISGGMCEIAADDAERLGVPLPELSASTVESLRAVLPEFGTPHNPLDMTGAAVLHPELYDKSITALSQEPGFAVLLTVADVPIDAYDDGDFSRELVRQVAAGQQRVTLPGVAVSHTIRPATALTQDVIAQTGINYLPCGVHHALVALAGAFRWSRRWRKVENTFPSPSGRGAGVRAMGEASFSDQPSSAPSGHLLPEGEGTALAAQLRPQSEQETLAYLSSRGVSVIASRLATSEAEAVAAAAEFGGEVVLKIASPDIAHKTEVGGVVLKISGNAAVAEAYRGIVDRVRKARPDARIEGVAVSPMRGQGIELFVGSLRDPAWGAAIAVGLGGIWVEALQDTSLRLLPVTSREVEDMLGELRGSKLLDGFRGAPAVDRVAIAKVIAAIGDAALALGPQLVSLEINPILVSGAQIEALDGLAIWDD